MLNTTSRTWVRLVFCKLICLLSYSVVSKSFETPWAVAQQGPQSMGFSRQECFSGLRFSPPGDLPDSGVEPASPALQGDSLLLSHQGSSDSCIVVPSQCKRAWKILSLAVLHFGRGTHIFLDSWLCDPVECHSFASLLLKNQDILMTHARIFFPKGFGKVYILESWLKAQHSEN